MIKCLVCIEESVLLQVVVQAHSPVCGTLELHKKVHSFFFGVVRLGGVWRGGGGGSMFQEGGVCMGVF